MASVPTSSSLPKIPSLCGQRDEDIVDLSFISELSFCYSTSEYGAFDGNSIFSLGGVLNPRTDNYEIRGVHGGKKKRYVIAKRAKGRKCCGSKIYLSVMRETLDKNCKRKKCPTGVPSLDGESCQDKCPDGGRCPVGQKAKSVGDRCEDDPQRSRKGKCPGDTTLDPKDGPQNLDAPNPKCSIDDEKKCQKPKIPAKKRAECSLKTHYVHVSVDVDGKATEECRQTRRYKERKENKFKELKDKLKEKWTKDKPEREKKESERKENIKKLDDMKKRLDADRKDREKLTNANEKKKARMGKYYYDEDFMSSADRLSEWPQDIDIDTMKEVTDAGVDAEAWLKKWEHIVSAELETLEESPCNKRSLKNRCVASRDLDGSYPDTDMDVDSGRNTTAVKRDIAHWYPEHDTPDFEKRNPYVVLAEIAVFAVRLAMSLLAR
ncbi:hypothetical protein BCR34DRAFT_598835 [Clohesyomyces aquaticus]|uniref:Uncharacterized protein n=1 Tax=Clohesyomyces aquaticus TaxID=1231657 RepID=A0A1Y1ZXF3_9PLEO|nr:hypothetical protein BCR34DRAFT_598835 [Clohesyomyces aquaticus]